MATRPPRACEIPSCSGYVEKSGLCSYHLKRRRESSPERRESSTKRGYDRSHRKIRSIVFAQQPICIVEGCDEPSQELDHINGDAFDRRRENLQGMCKTCHSKKTYREQGGFGQPKSDRGRGKSLSGINK